MNKKTTTIKVRIDKNLKQKFEIFCNAVGLKMSTAINMFICKVVNENKIPFETSLEIPNQETIKAIEDIENNIGLSQEFSSVKELMKALNDED